VYALKSAITYVVRVPVGVLLCDILIVEKVNRSHARWVTPKFSESTLLKVEFDAVIVSHVLHERCYQTTEFQVTHKWQCVFGIDELGR